MRDTIISEELRGNEFIRRPSVEIASVLTQREYNRERLSPLPGDADYVHLSDLMLFLKDYSQETFPQFLDYGCGGAPYRALFKTTRYLKADYVDCGGVDLLIGADGKVNLPDNCCDAILSTQVLEHVFSPRMYLSEAFRVLRPGGKLILTTHGMWEDHGCPYDFRRWTSDGLRRELEESGFKVKRVSKLTTGPRAILFLLAQIVHQLWDTRRGVLGWAWWLLQWSAFGKAESRGLWMDRRFSSHRVVSAESPGHGMYLALGIEGIK